jgi:hypothetical protein
VDVLIFDRWAPERAPDQPALVFAPPAAAAWIGTLDAAIADPRWVTSVPHPVTAGVDPLTLDLKRVQPVRSEALAPIAFSTEGAPLLSVRDAADGRLVVAAFSPAQSNLAYSAVFPVLVANAIEWLARPAFESPRSPGPMIVPGSVTRVITPDGQQARLFKGGDRSVALLDAPGLYRVESGPARSVVGVNVGSAEVSNLERTALPPDVVAAAPAGGGGITGRPWWMYAVLIALVLASAEWWTWLRRITV